MSIPHSTADSLIGQVTRELATLPEEDLPLVVEFVEYLKRQRRAPPQRRWSAAEIRSEARRRATQLGALPRAEIVARFQELAEAIQQEAAARGTAIERDAQGD